MLLFPIPSRMLLRKYLAVRRTRSEERPSPGLLNNKPLAVDAL